MKTLLVLPVVVPLTAAVVGILLGGRRRAQQAVGVCGAGALLGVAVALLATVRSGGVQAIAAGGWPAPLGIVWVADHLAAVMVLLAGGIGLLGALYAAATVDDRRQRSGLFPALHLMLAGVCGAVLTGDVFNLYVWFELLLVASFLLLGLGSERPQLEGTLHYLLPNLIGSALLLSGIALLYRLTGTLTLADIARRLPELEHPERLTLVAMLFLVALALKAASFPLSFWLPAAYPTAPLAVTAIFSALLTKVGVYALIRLFTLVFVQEPRVTQTVILIAGACTMLTGVLGAVATRDLKRLLSFLVISEVGFMLLGLGLRSADALAAALFFLVHAVVALTALFLAAGLARRSGGTYDLERLGGLARRRPPVAALCLVPALSLGGIPPLSGFLAKVALLSAAVRLEQYMATAVVLVVSLLTLFVLTRAWALAFWGDARAEGAPVVPAAPVAPESWLALGPAAVLAALTVALGLAGGPVFDVMTAAGRELLDPSAYMAAALGAGT